MPKAIESDLDLLKSKSFFVASSTSERPAEYFPVLDGIRGVAALLIAIRHTSQFWGPIICQESYLAVDIFFVLSGVVICSNYEQRLLSNMSAVRFSLIRLIRIYPLYALGSVIGFLAFICSMQMTVNSHAGLYFLLALFLVPNIGFGAPAPLLSLFPLNGPAWSLVFEMVVNVIYGFCARILSSDRAVIMVIIVSLAALIACVYKAPHHTLNIGFTSKSFPGGFARVGFSFFAGVLLCRLYRRKGSPVIPRLVAVPVSLGIIAVVAVILAANPPVAVQCYFDIFAAVILFPPLVYLALHIHPTGLVADGFRFCGAVSYALYAVHEPIGSLLAWVLQTKLNISLADLAPVGGILLIAGLIFACVFLDKFFDRPTRKFLLSKFKLYRRR